MITLNNSNIDFDIDNKNLGSKYSIFLSDITCNIIFRTNGDERMTVASNGNVGIGLQNPSTPLEVAGVIQASGLIISTGAGFSGKGNNLRDIPISGVTDLGITIDALSGNTDTVVINLTQSSNNLVNRILEETTYGSNYTFRINNELNTRVDNTSNYLLSTSNFLVNRIVMEVGRGSNYTISSSNILVNRIIEEVVAGSNYLRRMDTNASNYILTTSNILVNRIIEEVVAGSNYLRRMDTNASNYILTTSNILVNRIIEEVVAGSNYLRRMDTNASNYILTTSNILVNRIVEEVRAGSNYSARLDTNSSNLVLSTSNILVKRIVDQIAGLNTFVTTLDSSSTDLIVTTSNILVNRILEEVAAGSNYLRRMDTNASNYVLTTSNILVNRILEEVRAGSNYLRRMDTNASNYVLTTSNILVNRILEEVAAGSNYLRRMDTNASNYILTTSNILVNRILEEVAAGSNYLRRMDTNASNYIVTTSNILVNRILEEVAAGSNYLRRMDTNASNYILTTSNILVNRIVAEVGFGSNYARDRVGIWSSNYSDKVGVWGSNYVDKLNAIAIVSSQWTTSTTIPNTIFYNAGNVGIGTSIPLTNLHIYSSNNTNNNNNANSKLIIQESNTSNVFSTNISDIISDPIITSIPISGTIDKHIIFNYTTDNTGSGQTQYTITLPENYSYDVLMVGGGGGGAGNVGGGGGGGAVLYGSNIRIPSGTYNIKVGNGGNGIGQDGYPTEGFNAICLGGGGAKNIVDGTVEGASNGNSGGSGAGGKSFMTGFAGAGGGILGSTKGTILGTSIIFGNLGGAGILNGGGFQSGGGGGAGSVGLAGTIPGTYFVGSASGGSGIQLNITGTSLYWGAGGGGSANAMVAGNGGIGGGGAGTKSGTGGANGTVVTGNAFTNAVGMNAGAGTGSGGGGGSAGFQSNGGNGGSGIIIIRYRPLININGTPEMQLVIGDTIMSGASNYKIGNYNGNFQIKTSTSNIDTTSFIIQSSANVGIGTNAVLSKLHLYDNNSNAILTLQDNTSVPTLIQPTLISPSVVLPATSSTTPLTFGLYDRIHVFAYSSDSLGLTGQTRYTFTTSEDINADILVVGGGGAGGCFGGGGGAGQILLTTNYNIPAGTFVTVNVGNGGAGGTAGVNGNNGFESSITFSISGTAPFIANGGGGGGSRNTIEIAGNTGTIVGNSGGSGGGSSTGDNIPASLGGVSNKKVYPNNWKSFGNNGGIGTYKGGAADNHFAGGGGGAGSIGGTGIYSTVVSGTTGVGIAGVGGVGVDLSSIFGSSATVGASGWFGGGGGGMTFGWGTGGSGGVGGGGGGGTGVSSTGTEGSLRTGGGGGGGSSLGGRGGSGVVIIRYRQKNREGNSEIQFIKGSSISAGNTNYKIGNYGGDFKVKSSTFNTDTDRFILQSSGDTRFNSTGGLTIATIFNNGDIRAAGSVISDCDNRIKKDVIDIDVCSALRMIMAVEPKTYKYIDDEKGSHNGDAQGDICGDARVYGFIAQQIKSVIPEATEMRKNFLPNIMKRAVCDNNKVYLDLTGYLDLPLNEDRKVNIRFKSGGGYNFNIVEVNKEYFVIDNEDELIEEVFVYGYEVNDFHILTKDYIYTLNVSATQELCRKMERQEERIKELEDKLERMLG